MVAKRFLKIEKTYTDNQGHFYLTKEFNKVRLIAKFKNSQAIIRSLRRSRLWQILYAAERDFGIHKGSLNNLQLTIPFNTNALSRGARYWAAATAHNTVQEYYEYAGQNNIGTPPGGIRILLSNWHNASGATPMYAKRVIQELPEDFLRFYVLGSALYSPVIANLAYMLKREIDVTVGYNRFSAFNNADITRDADDVSEIMFHELTHAAHYNKVGNNWWNDFVDGELNNIIWHADDNPPYGLGNQGYTSDIIATGESWAYHMGHIMTDMKYGVNSNCTSEQANRSGFRLTQFCPDPARTVHPHIEVLEQYDPNLTDDPDSWIPKGLYLDLIDTRNESPLTGGPIFDNASGYTNQQFFNALQTDVRSVRQFRDRLLQQTGFSQQVVDLFNEYGYN